VRLLVTGADGLIGSNLAAAAAQQSWSVLGTFRRTPVSVLGARTARLDVSDRRACLALAEEWEPDVVLHAAAESSPGRLEREPQLVELNRLGTEHTLAAARTVRARYVLVSCDLVFSGLRPSGECWEEEDPTEPVGALGRSLLEREQLTRDYAGSWLITRPAEVYGVNLAIPGGGPRGAGAPGGHGGPSGPQAQRGGGADPWMCGEPRGRESGEGGKLIPAASGNGAAATDLEAAFTRARHVWEHSGLPLRWLAWLRAGRPLAAPPGIRRSPTYAWDYAQRVCELIGQECEGVYNTAGPAILGRLAHLRLLARVFGCDLQLVQEGSPAAFLRACGEPPDTPLPANTALCDERMSFALGHPAVDPFSGHRLMRRQLERLLGDFGHTDPPLPAPYTSPGAPPAPAPALLPGWSALG
jgi:dTDP-4-dehydrorhamnose reductase